MKIDEIYAELDRDLGTALSSTASYAERLIESEQAASHLAERVNAELPPRFEDLQRSFVANLESRLGELGENFIHGLDAKIRIKYYDAEIERKVTEDIRCSRWTDWHPTLAPIIQTVATGCAALGGIGTGLALAKTIGILPIKIPILFGSPTAAVLSCVALTCAASAVARRPEVLPPVMDYERERAQYHVGAHIATLRSELAQTARRATEEAITELEKLKMSHNSSA